MNWARLIAWTGVGLNQATIETERSVERLNHLEQANVLRRNGQCDSAAGTAMGSDQTRNGKLGDNLRKERTGDVLVSGDVVG